MGKKREKIWFYHGKALPLHPLNEKHRGVEQLVARQAHNLEVARSNPASATMDERGVFASLKGLAFFCVCHLVMLGHKKIQSPGFIHDNRICISLANSIRFKNACEVTMFSFHLCEHLLVISVGRFCCVLNAAVPEANGLLNVVFRVIVLLDNEEHLL